MKNKTKSLIYITMFAFLSASSISVKSQAFEKENFILNAGIGFGSVWDYDLGYGIGAATMWPTIYLNGEKGIIEVKGIGVISAGGELAYRYVSVHDLSYNWPEYYVGTRGAFHLALLEASNLDVYGGLSLGLRFYSNPKFVYNHNDPHWVNETRTSPYGGVFVGGRYYFSKNFAAFSELGYDITFVKFGFVFKF